MSDSAHGKDLAGAVWGARWMGSRCGRHRFGTRMCHCRLGCIYAAPALTNAKGKQGGGGGGLGRRPVGVWWVELASALNGQARHPPFPSFDRG